MGCRAALRLNQRRDRRSLLSLKQPKQKECGFALRRKVAQHPQQRGRAKGWHGLRNSRHSQHND